jgi:hypothetical protein
MPAVWAARDHCLETRTSIPLEEHWIEIHEHIACSEIHGPTSPPDLQRKGCGKDPHQQQHEVALLAHLSPSNESRCGSTAPNDSETRLLAPAPPIGKITIGYEVAEQAHAESFIQTSTLLEGVYTVVR